MAALVQTEWQLIYCKGYKGKVLSVFHSAWQKPSCTMSNETLRALFCKKKGRGKAPRKMCSSPFEH